MYRRIYALIATIALLSWIAVPANATIARRSAGTQATGSGAVTGTGNAPGTTSSGDVWVADTCVVEDSSGTFTCPTGWTHLTTSGYSGSANLRNNICIIDYTGTTPSLSFSWSENSDYQIFITAYSGVNTTTPNDGNGINTDTAGASATSLAGGTRTPSQTGDALLVDWCDYNSGNNLTGGTTSPTGLTNSFDGTASVNTSESGWYQILSGSSTTTAYTYTLPGGHSQPLGSVAFLLQPPGGAPATQTGWVFDQ